MKTSFPLQRLLYLLCVFLTLSICVKAQQQFPVENASIQTTPKTDTTKKRSVASKAALRSAILPGLGQAYNKKYWKIPIVYGVIAIPVSLYNYNRKWYNLTRNAYTIRSNKDSANFDKIAPELIPLSSEALRLYRNDFRKNMDFSILGILLTWGLNIVDATVDGHLRGFDISDEVSMKLIPKISTGNQMGQTGVSAVFYFGNNKQQKSIGF